MFDSVKFQSCSHDTGVLISL